MYPKMDRFLKSYSEGELSIFGNMLDQMISSTSAEIYRQARLKKDNPDASEESSITEEDEDVEDEDESPSKMGEDLDDNGAKKLKKLKPSGIVYFTHIDPDASSDEEVDLKGKKKAVQKQESVIDVNAAKDRKKANEEKVAAKKEREKKMKEINKNFPRKDKRETHRFLQKHGLTADEAKEYTMLGTNFDLKSLKEEDKKILENNFQA